MHQLPALCTNYLQFHYVQNALQKSSWEIINCQVEHYLTDLKMVPGSALNAIVQMHSLLSYRNLKNQKSLMSTLQFQNYNFRK